MNAPSPQAMLVASRYADRTFSDPLEAIATLAQEFDDFAREHANEMGRRLAASHQANDMLRDESMWLRSSLAWSYAGPALYRDDGELQDNRAHPFIDFRRDPVGEIEAKMRERATAEFLEGRSA